MSDASDWLKKLEERQREQHKERVARVLRETVPQHILATKLLADDLKFGEEGYLNNAKGLFFKERLVNKLMYLAYLHGRDDIDEISFRLGHAKAVETMMEKLEEL